MFNETDGNQQDTTLYTQYDQQAEQVSKEAPAVAQPENSTKDQNIRFLRDRAEMAERRNLELERMIKMNMSQQQSNKIQLVDEDDDMDIADDNYIEGKKYKKDVKSLRREVQNTRKEFAEFVQQSSMANAESRLMTQFSDFNNVVSKENLQRLADEKPVLYRTIMANQDIYDRGYTAYELLKTSGIIENSYAPTDKRLEENKTKPRSSANASPQVGDTPLSRVGDYDRRILTEARKRELRQQVEDSRRYKV